MIHDLKCWPEFRRAVDNETKTFELRKMDRDYRRGDDLCLREWDPQLGQFTGWETTVSVLAVYGDLEKFGLQPGYCIMSVKKKRTVSNGRRE